MIEKENSLKMAKNLLELVKSSQILLNSTEEYYINSSIKVCPWNESSYYSYAHSKQVCLKQCPISCTEITYDEAQVAEFTNTFPHAILSITWAPLPVLQIENRKKWDTFDFSGVLGGQV